MKLARDIFCSIYKSVIGIGPSLYHSQVKPLGASVGLLFGEPYLPGSNPFISTVNSPNHSKWSQIDPNHSGSFRFIPNHFNSHLPLTSPHLIAGRPGNRPPAVRLDCRNRFERCEVALLAATFPEAKARAYHVMPKGAAKNNTSESDEEEPCSWPFWWFLLGVFRHGKWWLYNIL